MRVPASSMISSMLVVGLHSEVLISNAQSLIDKKARGVAAVAITN